MTRMPAAVVARPIPSSPGRFAAIVAYLGGLGLIALSALFGALPRLRSAVPLLPAAGRCFDRILWPGLAIVMLVQSSLGAFLSMQAFFGATFRDGTGAVVGLGMLRNLGSLVSGWTLAVVMAILFIPELRRSHHGLDGDPLSVPDRDVARGRLDDPRVAPGRGRLAAARLLAGVLAGPVLALLGATVGIGCGLMASRSLLGLPPGVYVGKLAEMFVPFDIFSLAAKGAVFGAIGAISACHEGLRSSEDRDLPAAVFRAVLVAMIGISIFNGSWFTLAYLSGAPDGPALPS